MDEMDYDPKIARLPVPQRSGLRGTPSDIREELAQLLADGEPDHPAPPANALDPTTSPPVSASANITGPDPGHRNGIWCPQCDAWTWRATQHCIHCQYDLWAHAQRQAEEQHRLRIAWQKKLALRWTVGLTVGGIAAIGLSPHVPGPAGTALTLAGLMSMAGAMGMGKYLK
jgi:hypothetical protein